MKIANDMQKKVQEFASQNATTLLTAGGVVGVVGTGVLAWRGGYKYHEIIIREREQRRYDSVPPVPDENTPEYKPLTNFDKAQLAGVQFIPPILTGGLTIAAIIMSHRMSAQKAAALAAAYGLSRQQFEEYKEKVAEKLTGPKQEQVNAELAQERANRAPGDSGSLVVVEGGDMLCFDQCTGRYFKSNMEKINRAANRTNEHILTGGDYASANFFYQELGLPDCNWGEEVGFNAHNLLELTTDAIISPDDEQTPVIAIDFKRLPSEDYIQRSFE